MIGRWIDRVQGLLDFQKDTQIELISTKFNRTDLVELKIMLNTLRENIKGHWRSCDKLPDDEDMEYLLCISGKRGNVAYDHATVTEAVFEDGEWYLEGFKLEDDITVHAWMPLPVYFDDVKKC